MTDDTEPQSETSGLVLQQLLDKNSDLWKDAQKRSLDDIRPNNKIQSQGRELVLEGETEGGLKVTVTDTDFTRRELRTILDNPGTSYVSSHEEWQTTDRITGLTVSVEATNAEAQPRVLSLFLPDAIAASGVYQRPLQVTIKEGDAPERIVGLEDPDFAGLEAEIKYYLDDGVQWQTPGSSAEAA